MNFFDYKQHIVIYNQLPCRTIKSINHPPKRSYGLILYACNTDKWLLIKEKYTPFFTLIMHGLYRDSSLPFLLDGITAGELELLKILQQNYTKLESLYGQMFTNKKEMACPSYTYSRLQSPTMLSQLKKERDNRKEYWSFPSGKPIYNEDSFFCAVRECQEETGIRIDLNNCIVGNSVIENIALISGGLLCKTYWPVILPSESKLPNISTAQNEVDEARWMTNEDAKLVLSNSKYQLLQNILRSKFLINNKDKVLKKS